VYYNTVAEILKRAVQGGVSERELQRLVSERAFSESVTTIVPSLKSGKWQLLHRDLSTVLRHAPTMPLTTLQKRWLKAVSEDPRIRLFHIRLPDLDGVEPLFTQKDYRIYDKYADGDPFESDAYIAHFHLLREAIRTKSPVKVTMNNRFGQEVRVRFYPKGFEYSAKDDKIRILAAGCRFRHFNLGRITSCRYDHGNRRRTEEPPAERVCTVTAEITDERNTLERAMLHFAHFEKQVKRIDERRYLLRLCYYESDETELVIRMLSFGPYIKVLAPDRFVSLMRERLIAQKSCGLR